MYYFVIFGVVSIFVAWTHDQILTYIHPFLYILMCCLFVLLYTIVSKQVNLIHYVNWEFKIDGTSFSVTWDCKIIVNNVFVSIINMYLLVLVFHLPLQEIVQYFSVCPLSLMMRFICASNHSLNTLSLSRYVCNCSVQHIFLYRIEPNRPFVFVTCKLWMCIHNDKY